MTTPARPPLLATWLLGLVLPSGERAHVLGDLFEEYAIRAQTETVGAARRWYWGQVWRSLAPLLMSVARRRRWATTVGVAVFGYVSAAAIDAAAEMTLSRLLGTGGGVPASIHMLISLAMLLIGGYLAAKIRPRAEDVMAAIVFISVAGMLTMTGRTPAWNALIFLVVGPGIVYAGGRLSRRRAPAP